jgi:hypothetical protein
VPGFDTVLYEHLYVSDYLLAGLVQIAGSRTLAGRQSCYLESIAQIDTIQVMSSAEALRVLAELSASQWGMVTTAQAKTRGVQRLDISRLAKAGHIERLAHGVYRDAGAPSDEFESLRAAWLAADPSNTAEARLRDLAGGVVVMGASAASLHGVGDLPAERHELSSPVRRQTQRREVSYRHRQLEPGDVTIAHGLPATSIERVIADLVEARTDMSLVADVLRDAARARRLDTDRLIELLGPLAARNGLRKDDGDALLEHLAALAGIDTATLAEEIGTSEALSALVAANSLARFDDADLSKVLIGPATQRAIETLNESIARSVAQSIAPALEAVAAAIDAMPSLSGLETALSQVAEHVSLNLPARDLLSSFGEEWAAALTAAVATSGADVRPAIDVVEAARSVGLVSTRG